MSPVAPSSALSRRRVEGKEKFVPSMFDRGASPANARRKPEQRTIPSVCDSAAVAPSFSF